jgi:hypothetical protein
MGWRYQPVFTEQDGERSYSLSLCEVYFDNAGNLTGWTESEKIAPGREDIEVLTADLSRMMVDAMSNEPMRFSDLKSGMTFKHKVSMSRKKDPAVLIFRMCERPVAPINVAPSD